MANGEFGGTASTEMILELNELGEKLREACGEFHHHSWLRDALPIYGALISTGGFALAAYREVDEKQQEAKHSGSGAKHQSRDSDHDDDDREDHQHSHDHDNHHHSATQDHGADHHHHDGGGVDVGSHFFANVFVAQDDCLAWTS
ncbi:hypothetical protein [Rhodoligotrophos defluvii]|uniref:hypothetical protein n=1 Tax=Rhodoligotrophos defluvii TaxID=2561934 RepID=UPI0010C9EF94|nr:hypothetical protein [Rhodoligotrophos defluvii]